MMETCENPSAVISSGEYLSKPKIELGKKNNKPSILFYFLLVNRVIIRIRKNRNNSRFIPDIYTIIRFFARSVRIHIFICIKRKLYAICLPRRGHVKLCSPCNTRINLAYLL